MKISQLLFLKHFSSKNRIQIFFVVVKRMRVMKSTWDLLFVQKKQLSPLIIHTVASQQWNAVGLLYRVYPISEPLLCKLIHLSLQHMKLAFFRSHRSLFCTNRVKWLSAKTISQCNIAFPFKRIIFFLLV